MKKFDRVDFVILETIQPIMSDSLILESTITCPHCAQQATETMPVNACQYFYVCTFCGELLKPKPGDCCVFCSYGSVPCPPIQQGNHCC
ncbi:hypothetical protein HME7025_01586 [Aquirufa nivalisilvae]|uniref:Uncharacterized protein n=2 Tax=Aquirufa nivalisilvae TaxID=2516557 RepID=A0A2S2DVL2_9BACT|nr:hypothetical protein HME7025_01586 [Aquirufa nivalisilvae]